MDKTDAKVAGGAADEEDEENAEMWNADAVGSLTKGAVISLKVSIGRLMMGVF
jgi:ubiquitin-conjugating enzyme E2 O